jgi:hypothetical protein
MKPGSSRFATCRWQACPTGFSAWPFDTAEASRSVYLATSTLPHPGPAQLAAILGLPVEDIFPVHYDLSKVAVGHPAVVRGRIDAEPTLRLTEAQRMALIFGG